MQTLASAELFAAVVFLFQIGSHSSQKNQAGVARLPEKTKNAYFQNRIFIENKNAFPITHPFNYTPGTPFFQGEKHLPRRTDKEKRSPAPSLKRPKRNTVFYRKKPKRRTDFSPGISKRCTDFHLNRPQHSTGFFPGSPERCTGFSPTPCGRQKDTRPGVSFFIGNIPFFCLPYFSGSALSVLFCRLFLAARFFIGCSAGSAFLLCFVCQKQLLQKD